MKNQGIYHKLNARIRPNKHPYINKLIKSLNKSKVKYKYFYESENIMILNVDKDNHSSIKECLISPNSNGITIISFYNTDNEQQGYDHLMGLQEVVNDIFPMDLNYEIIGFS